MKNSIPISLDRFLDYTPADFEEVDKEILRVTKKVPAKYVGISSSADGDKHKCLELVEKEDRDWSVWLLVDQTEFGDHDYYSPREWNPMASRLFPKLCKFIESLPIVHVGRAIIMGIDADYEVTRHVDTQFLPDAPPVPDYDRLLNISFGHKKQLYMYDEETETKDYFDGRINWIDVSSMHGVDPDPFPTFSVRVDAHLKPEFRERIRNEYNV